MSQQPQDPGRTPPSTPPQWQRQPPPYRQQRHYQPPQPPPYGPPPSYAPPSPQPPRKSRKGLVGLGCGGAAALFILIAVLASSPPSSSAPPASPQSPAPASAAAAKAPAQTVTYVVTGSPADVTYGPAGSSAAGSVPMRVTRPLGTPLYASVSAQLQGSGSVSCEILVGGKVISRATASGGYQVASCEIVQDPLSGQWQDANG